MNIFFKDIKPMGQILELFLFMIAGLIIYMGVTMVLVMCGVDVTNLTTQRWMLIFNQLAMFAGPAVLWAALTYKDTKDNLKLHFNSRYWLLALFGIVVFLLMIPFIDMLTTWNQNWHFSAALKPIEDALRQMSEQSEVLLNNMMKMGGVGNLFFNIVVVALLPAVCEELFFRGALQTIITRWFGNHHAAIILTAFIFSLAHGDVFGLFPRWVMGLVLGYLFYYSGSILVDACAHFMNNAILVVYYYLYNQGIVTANPDTPMSFPWWVVLLCTIGGLVFFYVTFMLKRKKSMEKEEKNR